MPSLAETGFRLATVPDLGAVRAELARTEPGRPHILRVEVRDQDWAELRAVGLSVRPTWIHWVCPISTGAADLIGRMSGNQGRRSRNAVAFMKDNLIMEVTDPLTPESIEEWAELYRRQVANMPRGLDLASRYRAGLFHPDSPHLLIAWRRADGSMACGSVVRYDHNALALVGRFGAVAADERSHDLTRAMYLGLADFAARQGLRWLSLGNDPNIFGALVRPGLCTYKLRLGFTPVPADLFGNDSTRTVADIVTSLDGLDPPVLFFEYLRERRADATIGDFVDGECKLGLVAVTTPTDDGDTVSSLPEHRRVLLDA